MRARLKVSRAGVELIKSFEGLRQGAARLPDGRWTIGYGHTFSAREGAIVTQQDADSLLRFDLLPIVDGINNYVLVPLNQNQFDALVSFSFNIGIENFLQSSVLKRINEGRLTEAAQAMESWRSAEFNGQTYVLAPLIRRRASEKSLFLTPVENVQAAPSLMVRPVQDSGLTEHAPPYRHEIIDVTSPIQASASDQYAQKPVIVRMAEMAPDSSLDTSHISETPIMSEQVHAALQLAQAEADAKLAHAAQQKALEAQMQRHRDALLADQALRQSQALAAARAAEEARNQALRQSEDQRYLEQARRYDLEAMPTPQPIQAQPILAQPIQAPPVQDAPYQYTPVLTQQEKLAQATKNAMDALNAAKEAERLENERLEALRREREQVENAQLEAIKQDALKREAEQAELAKQEAQRLEAERQRQLNIEAEALRLQQLEQEKAAALAKAEAEAKITQDAQNERLRLDSQNAQSPELAQIEAARKAEAQAALMRFYSPYATPSAGRPLLDPAKLVQKNDYSQPVIEPKPEPVQQSMLDSFSGTVVAPRSQQTPPQTPPAQPVQNQHHEGEHGFLTPEGLIIDTPEPTIKSPSAITPPVIFAQPKPQASQSTTVVEVARPHAQTPSSAPAEAPLNWREQYQRPLPADYQRSTDIQAQAQIQAAQAQSINHHAQHSRHAQASSPGLQSYGQADAFDEDWVDEHGRIVHNGDVGDDGQEHPSLWSMMKSTIGLLVIGSLAILAIGGAAAAYYKSTFPSIERSGHVQDYSYIAIGLGSVGVLLAFISINMILKRLGGLRD